MENRRRISLQTAGGNNGPGEIHPNFSRYTNSKVYHEYNEEHDGKYPEQKTSEETIDDVEDTGINKNNHPNYVNAAAREKQRFIDHLEANMPAGLTAIQKLQKLKELQMKRDISERYYSEEIKRLIGEYYFGSKYAAPLLKSNGKLESTSFQPHPEDRSKNCLEPCGTMTTITRLNCGCLQETTRPIFTTTRGRVQRSRCSLSQDETLLKVTNPQEHLSVLEQRKSNYRGKSKKRFPVESPMYGKVSPSGDQDFETETEKIHADQEAEISRRITRTTSPCQKFSETLINAG